MKRADFKVLRPLVPEEHAGDVVRICLYLVEELGRIYEVSSALLE